MIWFYQIKSQTNIIYSQSDQTCDKYSIRGNFRFLTIAAYLKIGLMVKLMKTRKNVHMHRFYKIKSHQNIICSQSGQTCDKYSIRVKFRFLTISAILEIGLMVKLKKIIKMSICIDFIKLKVIFFVKWPKTRQTLI